MCEKGREGESCADCKLHWRLQTSGRVAALSQRKFTSTCERPLPLRCAPLAARKRVAQEAKRRAEARRGEARRGE